MKIKSTIKKIVLILLLLTGLHQQKGFAQAPTWQWARGAGSSGSEMASGSALDASGNLYVVGWYTSATITFGATTLTNPGSFTGNVFLVKYDASGNALWAKNYGGVDGELGNAVAVDAAGNVYITGLYTSTVMAMDSYTLTNSATGSSDIFITKIDPAGNVIWALSAGGSSADRGNSITVDALGNVFTTGGFNSPFINFGTGILTNAGSGSSDFFIVKHNAAGTPLWSKRVGGTGTETGNGVATDSLGSIYLTGVYSSPSIDFGVGTLTNSGAQDLFVAKYSSIGNTDWSLGYGGSLDDYGNSVAVRKNNVYVTGGFNSASINFSTTTLTNASAGTSDALLTKYDLGGNAMWAKKSGGTDSEAGNCVAVDVAGNVYATGFFSSSTIMFDAITVTNSAFGTRDLFIATYDGSGNALWAIEEGDAFDETAYCISVNASGMDIYVGGSFNSSMVAFGPYNIFKGCGDDVFVAKLLGPLVGIKEENVSQKLILYPNPTNGKFTVEAEGQIVFYNVLGEIILEQNLKNKNQLTQNEFDFSSQPKGIYFYQVITEKKGIYTGRVVVE